ncbi:hypothetical protein VULLAG_LOCUS20288 [Vulpes lagopus]
MQLQNRKQETFSMAGPVLHRKPPAPAKAGIVVGSLNCLWRLYPVTSVWGALWPAGGCRVRDNTARRREGAPADFRRQCRARPPPRARATRPRLFRTVGKAIGAEGVGASGAGDPRSPPGAPRLGLRAAPSRRMGPGAGSRHLPSPVSSSYPGHPTRPGSPRVRVRELETCGDAGLERKEQQQVRAGHGGRFGGPQTHELPPTPEGAAAVTAPPCIASYSSLRGGSNKGTPRPETPPPAPPSGGAPPPHSARYLSAGGSRIGASGAAGPAGACACARGGSWPRAKSTPEELRPGPAVALASG